MRKQQSRKCRSAINCYHQIDDYPEKVCDFRKRPRETRNWLVCKDCDLGRIDQICCDFWQKHNTELKCSKGRKYSQIIIGKDVEGYHHDTE